MIYDDKITRSAFDVNDLGATSHLPYSIYCPISRMPMQDPVIATDGHSYERGELIKWLEKKYISPISGQKIDFFLPNHNLRNTISELVQPIEMSP